MVSLLLPSPPRRLIPSAPSLLFSFSDRRINRWRNEVFKQVEYQANSPVQPIRCGRKEESVAQAAHTARYVEQERNYYRRVTYSDVLPLVESSHILHHAHRRARNNGLASEAIPILCKYQRALLAPSAAPRPAVPRPPRPPRQEDRIVMLIRNSRREHNNYG